MHTTCVQEKSHRATGPHIDTCVCHLAGSRHAGRPGYLNSGDRLGKPDDEQGARAVFVLSALANSLGKSVSILSALGDSVEKVVDETGFVEPSGRKLNAEAKDNLRILLETVGGS